MSHDQSAFKKVAVLTGLTMLVGGAEISEANAAPGQTETQTQTFLVTGTTAGNTVMPTDTLNFNEFNTSLGNLISVEFSLDSNVSVSGTFFGPIPAVVSVDGGIQIGPSSSGGTGTYDFGPTSGVLSPPSLAFYEGSSTFAVLLSLTGSSESSGSIFQWDGKDNGETGLTVTYNYTPISTTPLPAALPLFTAGLAGLGFTTWRSRRKQKTKKQT